MANNTNAGATAEKEGTSPKGSANRPTLSTFLLALLPTLAFIGIMVWAYGDAWRFFQHPARLGMVVATVLLTLFALFSCWQQHYCAAFVSGCFAAPAWAFGVGLEVAVVSGNATGTPICSFGIIFNVVGVSKMPEASQIGSRLRNRVSVQTFMGCPGTWICDIPATASCWSI